MHADYLIIGQGLAGTLLAHQLRKADQRVVVMDDANPRSSSNVAAGIVNPITGRNFVKSWRIDELIPCARETYRELEALLGVSFFRERKVFRALSNKGEENDWLGRTALPEYKPYLGEDEPVEPWMDKLKKPAGGYGLVLQGAQVGASTLISAYRQMLQREHSFYEAVFDANQLHLSSEQIRYGEFSARCIVFCEGYRAKYNPLFPHLPIKGDKGQVLIARIPGLNLGDLVKQDVFFVPLGEDLYWIGATYEHVFEDELPTEAATQKLIQQLENQLLIPFEVLESRSAVRPTVKDRRPLLGQHKEWPNVFVFNGLGTKGSSLGPFWARHFTHFLLGQSALDPAVDINRFAG